MANRLLEITQLTNLKHRLPNTLSGGQQQRVGLCRALMNRPKLLLMDEPLSALDEQMRESLQKEIAQIHKEFNLTTILVSHDKSEIYNLASRVVTLENGIVIKDESPKDDQSFINGKIVDIKQNGDTNLLTVVAKDKLIKIEVTKEEVASWF